MSAGIRIRVIIESGSTDVDRVEVQREVIATADDLGHYVSATGLAATSAFLANPREPLPF